MNKTQLKNFYKKCLYFIKRNIKRIFIVYLILMIPSTYTMTVLSTQHKFNEPDKVIKTSIHSPLNVITLGLYQPIKSGIQLEYGKLHKSISQHYDNEHGILTGQNIINMSQSWFNTGLEQIASNHRISRLLKGSDQLDDDQSISKFEYEKYPNYYKSLGLANLNQKSFTNQQSIDFKTDKNDRVINLKAVIQHKNKITRHNKSLPKHINNREIVVPSFNGQYEKKKQFNYSQIIQFNLDNCKDLNNYVPLTFNAQRGNIDKQGGIQHINEKVKSYLDENKQQSIYYEVQIHYRDKSEIPDYLIVSVMSNNKEINQKLQVFNASNGWTDKQKKGS